MCKAFPNQVMLGIDARGGRVATEGWLHESQTSALDLARRCADWPLAGIIYTDINRDGMLAGPNIEATAELAAAVPGVAVIASGGVSSQDDVARLARAGLSGCIIGRALYEGRIDLAAAITIARTRSQGAGMRNQDPAVTPCSADAESQGAGGVPPK
jgi:phosphoribosylformimino-5-aminoimidazole carboxamide ribotide isomerase